MNGITLPYPNGPDVLKNDEVDKAMKKASAAVALFKMLHPDAKEHTETISTVNSITEVKSWTAPGYEQVTKTLPQPDLGAGLAAMMEVVDALKLIHPGTEERVTLTVFERGVILDVRMVPPDEGERG
ncbi:MAG: hypothetical protein IJV00_02705 [Clostridia bacterium]|nr:hypothetical protein [Clostridia bacterium]